MKDTVAWVGPKHELMIDVVFKSWRVEHPEAALKYRPLCVKELVRIPRPRTESGKKYLRDEHMELVIKTFHAIDKMFGSFQSKEMTEELIELLSDLHRTEQQLFTNLFLAWTRKLADNHNRGDYDGRNAAACRFAWDIIDRYERAYDSQGKALKEIDTFPERFPMV